MGIQSALSRLRSGQHRARPTPEAFAVVHSADLDVHLAGVTRRPTSGPPWQSASWDRYAQARRREPSAMAKVLLDLHPAFAGIDVEHPRWLDVERAEAFAMEWAMFTPSETAQWLSAHPAVSAQQAHSLTEAGWHPRDAALALPQRVIDLDRRLTREVRRTG